jgi:hypothetical protein
MMTRLEIIPTLLVAALALTACKSAGMGAETRADITAQMKTAEGPIQECYAAALKQNRRIKGRFSIRLIAEANTGQFKNINVLRDEPNDPAVRKCVLEEIGKLKLAKPTGSSVQIDQPILFAPNN